MLTCGPSGGMWNRLDILHAQLLDKCSCDMVNAALRNASGSYCCHSNGLLTSLACIVLMLPPRTHIFHCFEGPGSCPGSYEPFDSMWQLFYLLVNAFERSSLQPSLLPSTSLLLSSPPPSFSVRLFQNGIQWAIRSAVRGIAEIIHPMNCRNWQNLVAVPGSHASFTLS